MKTPDFWQHRGALAYALWPLSGLYWLGVRAHRALAKPYTPDVPMVCIGNATAGGAGKTPVVRWLVSVLPQVPSIVLRGYGGRLREPTRVDPTQHSAAAVGDEALLHAAYAPTWVGASRAGVIQAATQAGARFIVMDDGYQNPEVIPSQRWLVVDGGQGFGNGFLLPAGALRQPIKEAIAWADKIIVIGVPSPATKTALCSVERFYQATVTIVPMGDIPTLPLLAFAGIAYPQRFFDALTQLGYAQVETIAFADHQPYEAKTRAHLRAQARQMGAALATTAKDAVRWPREERDELIIFDKKISFAAPDTAALLAGLPQ